MNTQVRGRIVVNEVQDTPSPVDNWLHLPRTIDTRLEADALKTARRA